jgi:hypothetical protein
MVLKVFIIGAATGARLQGSVPIRSSDVRSVKHRFFHLQKPNDFANHFVVVSTCVSNFRDHYPLRKKHPKSQSGIRL